VICTFLRNNSRFLGNNRIQGRPRNIIGNFLYDLYLVFLYFLSRLQMITQNKDFNDGNI
jgi:hypothetical protein